MSKYGVISGLYFPVFGLNTKIYEVEPEITPYLDIFHAVRVSEFEAYYVSLSANILFVLFQIQTLVFFLSKYVKNGNILHFLDRFFRKVRMF